MIPVETNILLIEVCNQEIIVFPVLIEKALHPLYSFDHLSEQVNIQCVSREVTPETAKTEYFANVLQCIIGDTYCICIWTHHITRWVQKPL